MSDINKQGNPIYDPFALHWSWQSQRHEWPSLAVVGKREQCDPATCEGCLASRSEHVIESEWWKAWQTMWAAVAMACSNVAHGWNPARDALLKIARTIDQLYPNENICPLRHATTDAFVLACWDVDGDLHEEQNEWEKCKGNSMEYQTAKTNYLRFMGKQK